MHDKNPLKTPFGYEVLLAEDNPVLQRVTSLLLKKMGIICHVASNGQEAVEMYKKNRYGLILMDLQMPLLDGLAATKQIHQFEQLQKPEKKAFIVAVTAHSSTSIRQECSAAGMNHILMKPFEEEELQKVIEMALNH